MKKMFLHLKIKTNTKQNLPRKSMINKNDRPLWPHHCALITLLEDRGLCHHKQKQAGVKWLASVTENWRCYHCLKDHLSRDTSTPVYQRSVY